MIYAIVDQRILDGHPIRAVSYLEPEHDWDSGFALFAGDPNGTEETALVCVDCLIDEHPNIGRALDIAHEHGEAHPGLVNNGNDVRANGNADGDEVETPVGREKGRVDPDARRQGQP